jgi:hypothetical protein
MKKILAIFLLALVLTGCGDRNESLKGTFNRSTPFSSQQMIFYFSDYEEEKNGDTITYHFFDAYGNKAGGFSYKEDESNIFTIKKNPSFKGY